MMLLARYGGNSVCCSIGVSRIAPPRLCLRNALTFGVQANVMAGDTSGQTPVALLKELAQVQKSGDHQLRLVVYPIIYDGFCTSKVVVWDFFHQQYQQFFSFQADDLFII